ncbi:hypothetical protein D3C81_1278650 [compost metagenome]
MNYFFDKVTFRNNISIVSAHDIANSLNQAEHERFIQSKHLAITNRSAEQTANNITAPFIRR